MSGVKRQKLDHVSTKSNATANTFCETHHRRLLDISDDVLLNILSHLSASDLYSLSRTCERFHTLCQDRTLWSVADFRGCRTRADELHSILLLLQSHTKFLAIRGFADVASRREAGILPESFLVSLRESCPQLETFMVEDYYIDVDKVDCRAFPGTVKCLSLKGCQVVDSAKVRCLSPDKSHFFLQVYVHLPNLEKLVLSYCRWFRLHSLMAISKCANLVELRLDGIRHLHDNVPYLSLATSFGFRKLKVLDMRNTTVGSSAMRGFNNLLNLTHLYLECPPQYRRKEISNPPPSTSTSHHCPESSDEDCEEVNLMRGHENSCVIVLRFGGSPEVWHDNSCVNDCCGNAGQGRTPPRAGQNVEEGEGTSGQGDGSEAADASSHREENVLKATRSPENKLAKDIVPVTSSVEIAGENSGNKYSPDSAIYVCDPMVSGRSKKCHQNCSKRNVVSISVAAGSSTAEQKTVASGEEVAKRPAACELLSRDEEHNEDLESGKTHNDDSSCAERITEQQKPSCACEDKIVVEGSESSEIDSSDDEASSEGNCRQTASCSKPGKKSCGGRLRSVELFSSARNAKSARTSCLGGRHEELIDDLSIDYFLSRDMWRVSLDGNIVRCNDRNPQLHTLVIRFYPHVTDKTLNFLYKIATLRYVDVTGTRVTETGVKWFRMLRPDVVVDSDYGESI